MNWRGWHTPSRWTNCGSRLPAWRLQAITGHACQHATVRAVLMEGLRSHGAAAVNKKTAWHCTQHGRNAGPWQGCWRCLAEEGRAFRCRAIANQTLTTRFGSCVGKTAPTHSLGCIGILGERAGRKPAPAAKRYPARRSQQRHATACVASHSAMRGAKGNRAARCDEEEMRG